MTNSLPYNNEPARETYLQEMNDGVHNGDLKGPTPMGSHDWWMEGNDQVQWVCETSENIDRAMQELRDLGYNPTTRQILLNVQIVY